MKTLLSNSFKNQKNERGDKKMFDNAALSLVIIGAINWLLVGVFGFDLVAFIFGGQGALISRIIYTLVGLCGLWSIGILFKEKVPSKKYRD